MVCQTVWVKKKSKAGSRLGIKFCKGQGSLACYSPWGGKESNMTERLNSNNMSNNNKTVFHFYFF